MSVYVTKRILDYYLIVYFIISLVSTSLKFSLLVFANLLIISHETKTMVLTFFSSFSYVTF